MVTMMKDEEEDVEIAIGLYASRRDQAKVLSFAR